jgi:hypothetical protein
MQLGPESSRRARAVEIWAALRSLGKHGVAELIDRTCRHATTFAEGLRAKGFDILNDVALKSMSDPSNDHGNAQDVEDSLTNPSMPPGGPYWSNEQLVLYSCGEATDICLRSIIGSCSINA